MSRMNNTSRSLRIISKQNGWDPDQIEGGGSLAPIYHEREHPTDSDTWPIPSEARDTSEPCPYPTVDTSPTFKTPELRENQDHKKDRGGSDPYPGMPGAD